MSPLVGFNSQFDGTMQGLNKNGSNFLTNALESAKFVQPVVTSVPQPQKTVIPAKAT